MAQWAQSAHSVPLGGSHPTPRLVCLSGVIGHWTFPFGFWEHHSAPCSSSSSDLKGRYMSYGFPSQSLSSVIVSMVIRHMGLSSFQSSVLYLLGIHLKVSMLCDCLLPLNWWGTFGMQIHELICVLLGFLTSGAPVHTNIDGSFSDMDPEISAFPVHYILIS